MKNSEKRKAAIKVAFNIPFFEESQESLILLHASSQGANHAESENEKQFFRGLRNAVENEFARRN